MRFCWSSGLSVVDRISDWSGKIVSVALFVPLLSFIIYEIVCRYVFNAPTRWTSETVIFLCGSYVILGGAYTLYHGAHVKMDLIYSRFSPRKRAVIDLITFPLFFLFCGAMVGYAWKFAWQSVLALETSGSLWNPPLYPFKLVLPIGAFLLLLQGVAIFIRNLNIAIKGGNKHCER